MCSVCNKEKKKAKRADVQERPQSRKHLLCILYRAVGRGSRSHLGPLLPSLSPWRARLHVHRGLQGPYARIATIPIDIRGTYTFEYCADELFNQQVDGRPGRTSPFRGRRRPRGVFVHANPHRRTYAYAVACTLTKHAK